MLQRITDVYQPAIQLTKAIILVLDQDEIIVSFNEFLESTTGYSYTKLVQKNWFDLFLLEKEIDSTKRYYRRFILGGKPSGKIVTKIITRGQKDCFIEWHYQRLDGEVIGGAVGLLVIGQNVSERVLQEKQLLNERNQLIERNKELTCLYSMAKIVARNQPLPQMLEFIAGIIPPAFRYPAIATAIIRLDAHSYGASENKIDSPTLSENLVVHDIQRGNIEVTYSPLKKGYDTRIPPFLDEEGALLKNIAHHLSLAIEKKEAIESQHLI